MINLKLSKPAPYFTFDYYLKTSLNDSEIDIHEELRFLQTALQALGANDRHVTVGTTTEIDKILEHHPATPIVNLQTGLLNKKKTDDIIEASYVFPFDSFEDTTLVFSLSSLGVPCDLNVLLSRKAISNAPPIDGTILAVFRKVMEDYARKGIAMIRRETAYKAAVIQHAVAESEFLAATDPTSSASKTVLAFFYFGKNNLAEVLVSKGYSVDIPEQGQPFAIYNSPTHSKEQFELLSDVLMHVK